MQKYWRIYIMLLPVIHHLYGSGEFDRCYFNIYWFFYFICWLIIGFLIALPSGMGVICIRDEDIQKLVKVKESMDSTWLNFVVSNMRRQDAHDLRNTKCLGWRHYVDSEWTEQSFSASPDPVDLKNLFYRGSILYNASQSHMV
jgi:hypothetical protein